MDKSAESQELRNFLNLMFPSDQLKRVEDPSNLVCPFLHIRRRQGCLEVSSEHIERADVIALRDRLDASLVQHQAKHTGLCPVRRSIYDQCFGESAILGAVEKLVSQTTNDQAIRRTPSPGERRL